MTGRLLLTGATGFVGRHAHPVLEQAGWSVRCVGRKDVGDFDGDTDWRPFLDGIDAVVHLAARAHVMNETATPETVARTYAAINRDATIRLGEQAAEAGVSRFVFMSTVKVYGDSADGPLTASSPQCPDDPYGVSKAEAENALLSLGGPMTVTILRPPLVYGPHVRGNFLKLIEAVERGIPLPLGAVNNRRSLVGIGNLTDAIRVSLTTEPGVYLPSDAKPVSTAEIVRRLAAALGRPARLLPVPVAILRLAGTVTGKSASIQRLAGSLVVEGALPGWSPPNTFEQELAKVAEWRRQR